MFLQSFFQVVVEQPKTRDKTGSTFRLVVLKLDLTRLFQTLNISYTQEIRCKKKGSNPVVTNLIERLYGFRLN